MSNSPEDVFNSQVWEILQDIKEESLVTLKGSPVKYRIPSIVGVDIIPPDRRVKILFKLEEEGAITVHKNQSGTRFGAGDLFYFYINNDKFKQKYNEYHNKCQNADDETTEIDKEKMLAKSSTDLQGISTKIVIADLASLFNEISEESELVQFFLKIARYGEYIQENNSTLQVLRPLYVEAQKDASIYKNVWRKFFQEWRKFAKDILALAQKAGIVDDPRSPLSNEIAALKQHLNKDETNLWESDLGDYFLPYWTLTRKFEDSGKTDLLNNHKNPDGSLVIYLTYNEARDAWDKFKGTRETKVWWAHYQVTRLAAGILGLKKGSEYFNRDDIVDSFYKYEFDEVAKGHVKSNPIVLHPQKYRLWIKRLHEYLVPRLDQINLEKVQSGAYAPQATFPKKLSRAFVKKEIAILKKTIRFGKKESRLLDLLADLEPKGIRKLTQDIPTKDCKHLKEQVQTKLKGTNWSISTNKQKGFNMDSFYYLEYLPG